MSEQSHKPIEIKLLQKARTLELRYPDGAVYCLSCEYLRVFSPSADVKGHGGQGATLQVGKKNVNIIGIDPVGHYAIKLIFDDGHDSGLYNWPLLYDLAIHQERNWTDYLARLDAAGASREGKEP